MIPIRRLNHAVLFVSKLDKTVAFYTDIFGFKIIAREGSMAFLRASESQNHHDLGLIEVGTRSPRAARGSVRLYHLGWELSNIQELAAARELLIKAGAFTGESDHGATKSVYGADPDGNEFELMILLPRSQWGAYETSAPILPLDWKKELHPYK